MDIKKLAYLYNLNQEQISSHIDYLQFNINEYCCFYEPEPYVEINLNEYSKPIEFMINYYSNINHSSFLSDALKEARSIDKQTLIKYSNNYENYQIRDYVILQYITNRPKIYFLTIWPIAMEFIDEIIIFLHKNGIVNFCRKIELSYLGAQNLINYLYNKIILTKTSTDRKLKFIDSKLQYTEFDKNKINKFYVIVFENINNFPISGTGAVFKSELRKYIMELIKKKYPQKNIELPDTVHINDFFYESIEYSQIYFHEQTLFNLEKKNLINWLDENFTASYLRLNAIKKWQIKNLSTIESQRLILLTGSSFFATGIRKSADVDSIFINIKNSSDREKELEKIIEKDFFNDKTKIPFADSGMPGTIAWKDSWTESNNKFYESLDQPLDDFILALDPSLYFFWNGIKIMSFEMTIKFKLIRYIPSDYVDFIILKELYPKIIPFEIFLTKSEIWKNKKNRSVEKINQLIIKSFDRYLIKDKRRINISKYLLK